VLALLRQGGVIDHQHGLRPTHQPIRLDQQFSFEWGLVPGPHGHEMMQLVVMCGCEAGGDRLHAFAITGTDQARDIERAHAPAGGVTQVSQKGLKPGLEGALPIHWSVHGRISGPLPSAREPTRERPVPPSLPK